ncbi:Heterokaryon incompatibility protein 6,OR allele [Lachnellula cervina]|uniref:Heterokaryon incompatibility protein 6,OR allele n=1 Tax=Lachnellula cervina TaxID=1316786 RepID=A0A7D8UZF2_9HELO|nr:Heterokaryon incompatibility protein 6,OR allele [Lachnellula cervina]
MANTYQYSPVPDTNSIRLIYLKPWRLHRKEKLRCELKTVSLDDDDVPEFEAISYAWGEPIFSREILIDDGSKLAITPSLGDALQRMRWNTARSFKNALQRMRPGISRSRQLSSSVRILWADAVCINQQDIDERSQQVQLMRKIYRGASRVLVWLGPGGPEVPVAMKLIKKISALREEELLELAQTDYTKMEQVSPEQNARWGLPAFDSADVSIFRTFINISCGVYGLLHKIPMLFMLDRRKRHSLLVDF